MPTPNIGLTQPASGTTPWDGIVNNNMTIIDNCLGGTQTVPAIAPTNIKPNNVTTILAGVGALVAKADLTAQAANVGVTTLYAVPASGAGTYRVTCYVVVTQAATTSSTLPAFNVQWIDNETSIAENVQIGATPSGNTVGLIGNAAASNVMTMQAKAGSNITFNTAGYASTGATPMQFSLHCKLEYLGL